MDVVDISGGSTSTLGQPTDEIAAKADNNDGYYKSVKDGDRYIVPWPSIPYPSYWGIFKSICCYRNNIGLPSHRELDKTLPIAKPEFRDSAESPGLRVTWIGHATLLVQMDGLNILTDPIFSKRSSPCQCCCIYKRYRPVPCSVSDLPKIDLVLVSHNHYDHLDYGSVKQLNSRFGSDLMWCVAMETTEWMRSAGCRNILELDWWVEHSMKGRQDVKIVCTPSQHWCRRMLTDRNKALWGSWCILGPTGRFYFAGDTGYCPIFEKIGERYGPFDLAAIPIGAYEPRKYLTMQHVDPEEAVQMHLDLKAKRSIGMHWGTFPLSYEFYLEPREKLREALKSRNIPEDEFFVLKHGESRLVPLERNTKN